MGPTSSTGARYTLDLVSCSLGFGAQSPHSSTSIASLQGPITSVRPQQYGELDRTPCPEVMDFWPMNSESGDVLTPVTGYENLENLEPIQCLCESCLPARLTLDPVLALADDSDTVKDFMDISNSSVEQTHTIKESSTVMQTSPSLNSSSVSIASRFIERVENCRDIFQSSSSSSLHGVENARAKERMVFHWLPHLPPLNQLPEFTASIPSPQVNGAFEMSQVVHAAAGSAHGSPPSSALCSVVKPESKKAKKSSSTKKKSGDLENYKRTHIVVERNRRKQMNQSLQELRKLMPGNFVTKNDQASIIGGAIDFVQELEHLVRCLEVRKRRKTYGELASPKNTKNQPLGLPVIANGSTQSYNSTDNNCSLVTQLPAKVGEFRSSVANVQVKTIGATGFIKVMTQDRRIQASTTIATLESLSLTVVQTNITTIENTALQSFSVQIGKRFEMKLDELAAFVHKNLFLQEHHPPT